MTLQEIGAQHWSGYVAHYRDDLSEATNKTTYGFCGGRIQDVRVNRMIVGRLDIIMNSKDNEYYLCDKDRKKL